MRVRVRSFRVFYFWVRKSWRRGLFKGKKEGIVVKKKKEERVKKVVGF